MEECSHKVIWKRKKQQWHLSWHFHTFFSRIFSPFFALSHSCCISCGPHSQPQPGPPICPLPSPCRVLLHTWCDARRCSGLVRPRGRSQPHPQLSGRCGIRGRGSGVWATRRPAPRAAAASDTHSAASQTAFSATRQVLRAIQGCTDQPRGGHFISPKHPLDKLGLCDSCVTVALLHLKSWM